MTRYVQAQTEVNANVNKPSRVNMDSTGGNALTTAYGIGSIPNSLGTTCTVVEQGDGAIHKSIFTCTAMPVSIADDAGVVQHGGVKFYDFPAGLIMTLGGTVSGNMTAVAPIIDNFDGDAGVGSTVAATGTGLTTTEQNIVTTAAISAGASDKIAPVALKSVATLLTESGATWIDGTATAVDMYLNFLIDDNAAHTATTVTFTGTITVAWMNLGDV
jgi:hypothetical protein